MGLVEQLTGMGEIKVIASEIRVIQKDGLNFVSLYFKIRTSDKYDANYV
jgi:hypothetical protein